MELRRARLVLAAGLGLAILLSGARAVFAHGVWIAQRAGEWTLVVGEGSADDAYEPSAATILEARDERGKAVTVGLRRQQRNAVLDRSEASAAVAASYEDGYWSQGADGSWVAGRKSNVPGAVRTGYYMMYTTTLLAPSRSPHRPYGYPLELVPLEHPMRLKKDQLLKVQVLFEGTPLKGARVVADYLGDPHAPPSLADDNGVAEVPLQANGLNVLQVSHTRPRKDPTEADEDGWSATLAFTLSD